VTVWQDSLFEAAATEGFTPLAPERHHLGAGAWVDVQRAWLVRSELLFDRLVGSVPWRAERRPMYDRTVDVPRLVAFYDESMPLPDPRLDEAKRQLCTHYGEHRGAPLCTAGLCLYRNGRDSVAWHGDTIGRATMRETLVAILSLGGERTLRLRPTAGGPSLPFRMGSGDLVVMGGACQRTWQHAVPKTRAPVAPRISVQFRSAGVR
jgi:alkylated DNA repair dioxygenase AlkB